MGSAFVSYNYVASKCINSCRYSMTSNSFQHAQRCNRITQMGYCWPRRRYSSLTQNERWIFVTCGRFSQKFQYRLCHNYTMIVPSRRGISSMVASDYSGLSRFTASRPRPNSTVSDSQPTSIWDTFVTSAVALAVSMCLFYICPLDSSIFLSSHHLLHCEAAHNDLDSETNGDGKSARVYSTMPLRHDHKFFSHSNMKSSDGEMAFREPHVISEQLVKAHISSSHSLPVTESASFSSTKPYDISVRAVKGGRVTMEDEFIVADGGRFVAVFDGHGGGGVSQFLKNHLYDAVRHHLQEKHWEENDALLHPAAVDVNSGESGDKLENKNYDTPSVFSHAAAVKAAFMEIEENVLADSRLKYQGSTAVAVILHESHTGKNVAGGNQCSKHRTLLSANIGDSRAVLSRDGRAVNLTRDHKPNDHQEKERILAMGETIQWDRLSKVYRVRNLSLSRAIGDKYAKPVVSSEVEINHYPVVDKSDEFVLLASDGLWDVMSSEEAVAYVHETMERGLSNAHVAKDEMSNCKLVLRRNMAKYVAREALRRGSSDNVCVVIVWLR